MYREDFKKEIKFPGVVKRGESGTGNTKRVQEWICLHKTHSPGFNVSIIIDDDFGPATEMAVKKFQDYYEIPVTGVVNEETWDFLVGPMLVAFEGLDFHKNDNLQDRIVKLAHQFLDEHPVELYTNRGPWVRAFMKGLDSSIDITGTGQDWAQWCNGFVSTVLDRAYESLGLDIQDMFPWTWSCYQAIANAKKLPKAQYISHKELKESDYALVAPGDLFFVMVNDHNPMHIGIVSNVKGSVIETVEGNTNDEGSNVGYEVCSNYRNLANGNYSIIKLTL